MQKERKITWLFSTIFLTLGFLFLFQAAALACEIEITPDGDQKAVYAPGDEVILKVKVFLTHRNCPEGIEATTFKTSGLEVLGATDWVETARSSFERLIKVRVTDGGNGQAVLYAERTCSKEGGRAELTLKVAS